MSDLPAETRPLGFSVKGERGTVFSGEADDEAKMATGRFEERLMSSAIWLSEQDGSDSVSASHVKRAYWNLVSERRQDKARRIISSTLLGSFLSGFLSVLVGVGSQSAPASGLQVLLLAVCFAGAVASGGYLGWYSRG